MHKGIKTAREASVGVTLQPGQNGTKKLTEKYGEKLVCVRKRYDGDYTYTTVEIVVSKKKTRHQ
jgi:hypothetical protein